MRGALSFMIITFLLASSVYAKEAKDCSMIDNRDDSLKDIRDQGDVGWCYAYAAADLLSYKLKKKISAVDLAYIYNQENPDQQKTREKHHEVYKKSKNPADYLETDIDSGDAKDAIDYTKKYGACEEKYVPSDDKDTLDLSDSLKELQQLKQAMKDHPFECRALNGYSQGFQRYPNMNVMDLLNVAYTAHQKNLMFSEDLKACEGHRIDISQLKTNIYYIDPDDQKHSEDNVMNAIDYGLEHGNIAAASYKFAMLEKRGSKDPDTHESIVVGREYNYRTKQCEYLVRNSFGSAKDKESPVKNKDGYYLVPENKLRKFLISVTTID